MSDSSSRARLLALAPAAREAAATDLIVACCSTAMGSHVGAEEPVFLTSLEATGIKMRLDHDLGIDLPLDGLLAEFTPSKLASLVTTALDEQAVRAREPGLHIDHDARHEPFPLTEIQRAYLLGRSGVLGLGNVSTHFYVETELDDLDVDRLEGALHRLIDRHDMLRAIISSDGHQRILPEAPPYRIEVTDLDGVPEREARTRLEQVRERMSHAVLPADQWPLFDVRAHRLGGRRFRLHFGIDLLITDGSSILTLLSEWSLLYRDPGAALPAIDVSFRDYVLATTSVMKDERHATAREYWLNRLPTLPPAPELPQVPGRMEDRFTRRSRVFDKAAWTALQETARQARLTPSALLCAAYAHVLGAWSKGPHFTLNVTVGERMPLHPDVNALVGDFTSSLLLEVTTAADADFGSFTRRLQDQLRSDLEHRAFGGVEVLRELARAGNGSGLAGMPIVFTSMIGSGVEEPDPLDGGPFEHQVFTVSQTPQVLLDNQVLSSGGRLHVSWDAVEDRFPAGVLDAMFDAYCLVLERLARGERVGGRAELLSAEQRRCRDEVNATDWDRPTGLLHTPIERWARETPDAPAVICAERVLAFSELDSRANQVARLVQEHGIGPGHLVAVVMNKGWEEIVAVLGILRAGAAYLPVSAALPAERIHHLLQRGEVRFALTQSAVGAELEWPADVSWAAVDATPPGLDDTPVSCPAGPDDLAYVIFTSGSTGQPKGVMIPHSGAANTVLDVNHRFEVGPGDRVLAVSSLSFDLSVYDIFGLLGSGGAVVIPDAEAERDPALWAELLLRHRVTIWNSVPALLGLIVDYGGERPGAVGDSLRLAMLSGDWVPLELPGRVRALIPGADVVSLGGATEGSIWSILHPVGDVEPSWASIPYGRAMRNQRMHVMDAELCPRPDWAIGEICIGGVGVAAGYWRDDDRTADRFVTDPQTGERLYRTGDLGRFLPGGDIEFLGREDFQVKVRGHRVELGEIETTLIEHPAVRAAAVTAVGEPQGPKRLVAHYTPGGADPAGLRDFLAERLPDYMVPAAFVAHEALPLTANGKVDRGALATAADTADRSHSPEPSARHHTVGELARIWCEVLGVPHVSGDDEFFAAGGDSLLALRMAAKAGAAGIRVRTQDLLSGTTFGELADNADTGPASAAEQGFVTGPLEFTPTQHWFLEQDFTEAHHWNGMWPLLSVGERLDPVLLGAAVHRLLLHHDGLRTRFRGTGDGWTAAVEGPEAALPVPFGVMDLSAVPDERLDHEVAQVCARLQASLDIEHGPLIRVTYLDLGPGRAARLHVAAHWITLDYYSARIFFEDLQSVYAQLQRGLPAELPPKTTPVTEAGRLFAERARGESDEAELAYWLDPRRPAAAEIPVDLPGPNTQDSAERVLVSLDAADTTLLTQALPRRYGCEVREVLLLALSKAFADWTGRDSLVVDVEGHGREDLLGGADISRTVGRFTTIWPLLVEAPATTDPEQALASVVRQVRKPRDRGVWYGMLRYLRDDLRERLDALPPAPVGFNYWGQVGEFFTDRIWPSTESPGPHRSPAGHRVRPLDVLGFISDGELSLLWTYSENVHHHETVTQLAEAALAELRALLHDDAAAPPAPGTAQAAPRLDGRWGLTELSAGEEA